VKLRAVILLELHVNAEDIFPALTILPKYYVDQIYSSKAAEQPCLVAHGQHCPDVSSLPYASVDCFNCFSCSSVFCTTSFNLSCVNYAAMWRPGLLTFFTAMSSEYHVAPGCNVSDRLILVFLIRLMPTFGMPNMQPVLPDLSSVCRSSVLFGWWPKMH